MIRNLFNWLEISTNCLTLKQEILGLNSNNITESLINKWNPQLFLSNPNRISKKLCDRLMDPVRINGISKEDRKLFPPTGIKLSNPTQWKNPQKIFSNPDISQEDLEADGVVKKSIWNGYPTTVLQNKNIHTKPLTQILETTNNSIQSKYSINCNKWRQWNAIAMNEYKSKQIQIFYEISECLIDKLKKLFQFHRRNYQWSDENVNLWCCSQFKGLPFDLMRKILIDQQMYESIIDYYFRTLYKHVSRHSRFN